MPVSISVDFLSHDDLRRRAREFLANHHPAATIPIPIEEIVEFVFRIDIIPTPGLHRVHDIDAFITSDLTSIYVDEFVYASRPGRYRFSLAHELAHAVLHRGIFQGLSFSSIAEWLTVVQQIPEKDYSWIEWQAYAFAGLVLVPEEALRAEFEKVEQTLAQHGLTLHNAYSDAAKRSIAGDVSRVFEVSADVIEKRATKDHLWGE
jgi:hypothetical protein